MIIKDVDNYIVLLQNQLLLELNRTLSAKLPELYIQKITNNIIQNIPNNLFDRTIYYICLNMKDLFLLIDSNMELYSFIIIVCDLLKTIPKQLNNILNNTQHAVDKIIFDFMEDVSKNNVTIDSALRLSEFLRNFLFQKSNSFIALVLNNNDFINEIKIFNNNIKNQYPTSQNVSKEFYTALEKVCNYMNMIIQLTIMKTISEASGTNNRTMSIIVGQK